MDKTLLFVSFNEVRIPFPSIKNRTYTNTKYPAFLQPYLCYHILHTKSFLDTQPCSLSDSIQLYKVNWNLFKYVIYSDMLIT